MLIAQITDMHVKPEGEMLTDTLDSNAMLEAALMRINTLNPQPGLLLATGDLTADGKPEEYEALRGLLSGTRVPKLLLPGNHDNRENLRAAFPGQPWEEGRFLLFAVDEYWPVRIVALDSVTAGKPHGELCAGRCRWLDDKLAEAPDKPTIVALHHPPFVTGIDYMDAMGLLDPSGLAEVIARHKQVIRILCGHIHRPVQATFAGTSTTVAPATSFQVGLNLDDHSPILLMKEPPAFQLHSWTPESGLVSHTVYVEEFGHWLRPANYKSQSEE